MSIILCISCEKPQSVNDIDKDPVPPSESDGIYHFSIWLHIDKESVDAVGGLDVMKERMKKLFENVNDVYNEQKIPLKGKYSFEPDIENIVVYEGNRDDHWQSMMEYRDSSGAGFSYNYMAIFDGLMNNGEEKVSSAGWAATGYYQGISIHSSSTTIDADVYPLDRVHVVAHELGHLRGCRDLYPYSITAGQNRVNGMTYTAMPCIMGSSSDNQFGDYSRYILDLTEDKIVSRDNANNPNDIRWIINNTFMPESIKFRILDSGVPSEATVNLYKRNENDIIDGEADNVLYVEGEKEMNCSWLFEQEYTEKTYLVEIISEDGLKKHYDWLIRYELERAHIVKGLDTYEIAVDLDTLRLSSDPNIKPELPNGFDAVYIAGTWWLDRNLGAEDIEDYGDGYQWGRPEPFSLVAAPKNKKDGPIESHSELESGVFYTDALWHTPIVDNFWNYGSDNSPKKTEYDPCPEGWRIPTIHEFEKLNLYQEFDFDSKGNYRSKFQSEYGTLYMPIGGQISTTGNKYLPNWGQYWTSSLTETGLPRNYAFNAITTGDKVRFDYICSTSTAFPVRCVKE